MSDPTRTPTDPVIPAAIISTLGTEPGPAAGIKALAKKLEAHLEAQWDKKETRDEAADVLFMVLDAIPAPALKPILSWLKPFVVAAIEHGAK